MVVKQVQSAARVLATFETLAEHQPVGVSEVARLLGDDKSAVQRALVTLADAGWIERVAGGTRWQVAPRVLVILQRRAGLRDRARATLEALQDETNETVALNVPEKGQIVVLDAVESNELVRTAAQIGLAVPPTATAAGQAILAYLPVDEVALYVGGRPDARLLARLEEVRTRGWAINAGDVTRDARAVGSAILDAHQRVIASIAISAPADRIPQGRLDEYGHMVAAAARRLSNH